MLYLFIYLFRYNGNDAASNMAVVAVNMVSGWLPDKDSIHSVRLCLFPQSPEDQDLFFQTLLYTNCSACTQCLQTDPVVVPFYLLSDGARRFSVAVTRWSRSTQLLLLGWFTCLRAGKLSQRRNQPPRPTQPGHPSVGRRNEYWWWLRPPLGKKTASFA